jgi:hypothetical protein
MKRNPSHATHLDMDAKMVMCEVRDMPVRNATATDESKAGRQDLHHLFHLGDMRHARAGEVMRVMMRYPPVRAIMVRPPFKESA